MMDTEGLRHYIGKGREPPLDHVVITLRVDSREGLVADINYRKSPTRQI